MISKTDYYESHISDNVDSFCKQLAGSQEAPKDICKARTQGNFGSDGQQKKRLLSRWLI